MKRITSYDFEEVVETRGLGASVFRVHLPLGAVVRCAVFLPERRTWRVWVEAEDNYAPPVARRFHVLPTGYTLVPCSMRYITTHHANYGTVHLYEEPE